MKPFLTARWSNLVMLNYAVDPAVLRPYVPAGTTLDTWQGTTYVSVVGFLFSDTRVRGVRIPFHETFEEVNLRFYVLREVDGTLRRGVVFVKEIVPRFMISLVARTLYNENYVTFPMQHAWSEGEDEGVKTNRFAYTWRKSGVENAIIAEVSGDPQPLEAASEAEFITEHYWGYTRQRDGGTLEYQVEHPAWRVWDADVATLECDVAAHYGPEFAKALQADPVSAFVAKGSEVAVYPGTRIV